MNWNTSDGALPLTRSASHRRAGRLACWLAARVQDGIEAVAVRLELWDGSSPYRGRTPPVGDLVVHDLRALIGIAVNPDLYFGEAYMAGRLDVRGGLQRVIDALSRSGSPERSPAKALAAAVQWPNTPGRARRNVHHHYDLGNDFYRLWLDEDLAYTCAYFATPDLTLEQAQRAKFDLVCRKLQLRPGDTVVEAGCGWGGLALHMARHYGARVRAFNVSREQLAFARDRARREGLGHLVEFVDDDYRNIAGTFDAFVSVGMLEHVGLREFATLAAVIRRALRRDGGRGLLHFIGRDAPRPLNPWIRRRIFPGGYPPTMSEVADRILTPAGMSILDVENLRLHYARTLGEWSDRYFAHEDEVRARYGDAFARAWALYLAGSRAAFTTGWMQLFQVVFAPYESVPPYWTRAAVYGDAHARL
jgi:cyclopropane-fatty-acyl-phospholipid synthase